MSAFLLGLLIAGIIGGTIAYQCYSKRELVERTLRTNIKNIEYNMQMLKKETSLKIEQLSVELKKTKESNRKAFDDLERLGTEKNYLTKQLAECQRRLAEEQ